MPLKFGVCGGLAIAEAVLAAGFDYMEVSASEFTLADPFDADRYRVAGAETSNLFFPGHFRLLPDRLHEALDFGRRAIDRAQQIGIELMVVGSGGVRRADEGEDPTFAQTRFVAVVAELNTYAAQYGIRLAPESLNRTETNVGNDLASLAHELSAAGVGYTADTYHVLYETDGEPNWPDQMPIPPSHVHIADRPRNAPRSDDPAMQSFAQYLRAIGYDGRISVESHRPDDSVETFRSILANLNALFR